MAGAMPSMGGGHGINPMLSGGDNEITSYGEQSTVPVAQAVTGDSGDIETGHLPPMVQASHKVSRLVRPFARPLQ